MPTRRLWLSCADLRERGWQDLFPPPTPTFREVGATAMISMSKTREARKRRPALRSVRRCGRSHLLVATAMSAMTVSIVESNRLVEFPSGARCMWNDLPHPAQFAIIFLMLVLLFGVHRIFGKLDNAAYARLSRAVTAWMNERRHAHQG